MYKIYFAILALIYSSNLFAADIRATGTRLGEFGIRLSGVIEGGDSIRFKELIDIAKSQNHKISKIYLDSPGGSVKEGVGMAGIIRKNGFKVEVPSSAMCASACFMLFSAGISREYGAGAQIGVHSVNIPNFGETIGAKSITVDMVRYLADLGAPDQILGRLVRVSPNQMGWLTVTELNLMSRKATTQTVLSDYAESITDEVLKSIRSRYVVSLDEKRESRRLNKLALDAGYSSDSLGFLYKATTLNPYDAEILTNYGFYLHISGNARGAVDILSLSLNLNSRRGSTWVNLGEALSDLGDHSWAVECFVNYYKYSSRKQVALDWLYSMVSDSSKPTRSAAAKSALEIIGIQ